MRVSAVTSEAARKTAGSLWKKLFAITEAVLRRRPHRGAAGGTCSLYAKNKGGCYQGHQGT